MSIGFAVMMGLVFIAVLAGTAWVLAAGARKRRRRNP